MYRARTAYISERIWRGLDQELRKQILAVYGPRKNLVGNHACNIESKLRMLGEYDLIDEFYIQLNETYRFTNH